MDSNATMLNISSAICKMKAKKWKSFSCVWFFATPWTIHLMELYRPEYSLLQGIFPTQGLNPGLPHCRQICYVWATREAQWKQNPILNLTADVRIICGDKRCPGNCHMLLSRTGVWTQNLVVSPLRFYEFCPTPAVLTVI